MNNKLSEFLFFLVLFIFDDRDADYLLPVCSELFSSLLGQKVRVDEEDEDKNADDVEMDGLRLFRS